MRILLFLKIDFSQIHDLSVQIMTETKKAFISEGLFCDPPGARTQDPNIKSVVLYLLS